MGILEFIYTVLLKPRPLKMLANRMIRCVIPPKLKRHGSVIVLNQRDPSVSGALTFGVYEKAETYFFLNVCREGMVFLDIGANVGYYSALAATRIGDSGRIIALEPDKENFAFLQQTLAANGVRDAVCVPKAAAAAAGLMRLYVSDDNRGDNRLYANELCTQSYEVEVIAVDDLLDELGIPKLDLVKIDVQGFEGHVLDGMMKTICRSHRLIILFEFWSYGLRSAGTDPVELLEQLENAQLRLFELLRHGRLRTLRDKKSLVDRQQGRKYTNIVGVRGDALPASVKIYD